MQETLRAEASNVEANLVNMNQGVDELNRKIAEMKANISELEKTKTGINDTMGKVQAERARVDDNIDGIKKQIDRATHEQNVSHNHHAIMKGQVWKRREELRAQDDVESKRYVELLEEFKEKDMLRQREPTASASSCFPCY